MSCSYATRVSFERGRYVSTSSTTLSSTLSLPAFLAFFELADSRSAAPDLSPLRLLVPAPATSGLEKCTRSPILVPSRLPFRDMASPEGSLLRGRWVSEVRTRLEFARYSYWRARAVCSAIPPQRVGAGGRPRCPRRSRR